jgi:16S rRNA (adenine(1408)-N(1))-methyltransferase
LGTGDGRAVLARAQAEPRTLVIGIDASAPAMAEVSRRAARPANRGGAANALFVVAAAERPPLELLGVADELTIQFPWGSLLHGALAVDLAATDGIAALIKPGGRLTTLISLTDRDGLGLTPLDEPGAADALAGRWAAHGLRLELICPATDADVAATRSSWARRLGVGRARPAWRLAFVKAALRGDAAQRRPDDVPARGR